MEVVRSYRLRATSMSIPIDNIHFPHYSIVKYSQNRNAVC
jgi:hypothetical protein